MKNKEKFAKEIIDIACNEGGFAVEEKTGNVVYCDSITCSDCLFAKTFETPNECIAERRKWAESEYIEKPVISKRDRAFLEYIDKKFAYITRSFNEDLYLFVVEPRKDKAWTSGYLNTVLDFCDIDFPMVKWSDSKPWLIEDLKKLEVVDEY